MRLLEARTIKNSDDIIDLLKSGKLAGRLGGKKFIPGWCLTDEQSLKDLVDVTLDTIERDKDGSWRTIDLVQYFKNQFPNDELYLIIGEDSFKEFKTWTRYEDILQVAKLIVANRKEHVTKTKALTEKGEIPAIPLDMGDAFEDCSATNVRNRLIEDLMDMYLSDKSWYNTEGL